MILETTQGAQKHRYPYSATYEATTLRIIYRVHNPIERNLRREMMRGLNDPGTALGSRQISNMELDLLNRDNYRLGKM